MNNHLSDEAFALELAEALNDTGSLAFYRRCVEWYDEDFLRQQLSKVLSIPQHKIHRSRGALFNRLVSSHAKKLSRPWN